MRIGVLRGGISSEYDISIKSGGKIMAALESLGIEPVDMLVTRDGTFHVAGIPRDIESIPALAGGVFIALHGKMAEDGRVQQALESLSIPHNGTSSKNIARTLDKHALKNFARELGVKVPDSFIVRGGDLVHESMREGFAKDAAQDIWSHIAPPWVVKPVSGGSSKFTHFAGTFPELEAALMETLLSGDDILAETFIPGRELHVFVAEHFRNQDLYTAPPIEIFHGKKILEEKDRAEGNYDSALARFSDEGVKGGVELLAKKLFQEFGLKGYATMDFLVTPKDVYLLEIDALPAIDDASSLSHILETIGAPLSYFTERAMFGGEGR